MHFCAYIVIFLVFITQFINSEQYTLYQFEWNNPNQWSTNSKNNEIISCVTEIPKLCIYAIPHMAGFQLFYDDLMFDFLNDDQWSTINIIQNVDIDTNEPDLSDINDESRRRLFYYDNGLKDKLKDMFGGGTRLPNYGCFNALCTTVLGAPTLIGMIIGDIYMYE